MLSYSFQPRSMNDKYTYVCIEVAIIYFQILQVISAASKFLFVFFFLNRVAAEVKREEEMWPVWQTSAQEKSHRYYL